VPTFDHRVVLHLDPSLEVVGLTEAVAVTQPLEISLLELVGRWLVVVSDPEVNGILGIPWIASDGIQEIAVTEDSMRMGPSLGSSEQR
jgi:hypothetical protein